jgi:TrmH RNA methyltransferase
MRNKLTEELAVCGVNAVAALAEFHPEKINRLFLREDRLKSFTKVCKGLAELKRPYKICDDEELETICKSNHHQGIAAIINEDAIEPMGEEDLELWAAEGKTGLILCSVGNDHNLGAIVRSAAFFDAHFVIICEDDTEARLTTSAYRIAEGGMEHVVFRSVRSTAAFIKAASKKIVTIGTEPRARLRIRDLSAIVQDKKKGLKTSRPGLALVLGNEEVGLPHEVTELCSCLVRIPGTGNIESLNVAQAATLFLHELYEL